MSTYSDDLLLAAAKLQARDKGQKGPLKAAFARRSISTSYYAIFHFMLDETAARIVGTGGSLRQRRRAFARTLTHASLAVSFSKLKGATIDKSIEDLFRLPSIPTGPIRTPPFIQQFATAFLDAKTKREDADYNLDQPFGETDARQLHQRVTRAVTGWRAATAPPDRDAKDAVAILISVKGRLREQ